MYFAKRLPVLVKVQTHQLAQPSTLAYISYISISIFEISLSTHAYISIDYIYTRIHIHTYISKNPRAILAIAKSMPKFLKSYLHCDFLVNLAQADF